MKKILVIGSSNIDFISKMKKFPAIGETIEGLYFFQAMGGKGANQALAAHKLGGNVQFITSLGNDSNGNNTIQYYRDQKLDVSFSLRVDAEPSGTAMIWVDEQGDNSIVINPGANKLLTPDYIVKLEKLIAEAYIVVLQMEIPYETVKTVCEIAHKNNTKILLNVAPAHKIDSEILQKIDILVVNETEAETITGCKIDVLDIESIVDKLISQGAKSVILTLGKKGSLFKKDNMVISIPAFQVEPKDSTAAGDIFCGAFSAEFSKYGNWKEALIFATAAAALSVTRVGAQPSIPTETEVRAFLCEKHS